MNFDWTKNARIGGLLTLLAIGLVVAPAVISSTETAEEALPFQLQSDLESAIKVRLSDLTKDKNDQGARIKRSSFSKVFKRVDDSTFLGTFHIDTASETEISTQRYEATITNEGGKWSVSAEDSKDTQAYLTRDSLAVRCNPFDSLSLNREGMQVNASNGWVCEGYVEPGVDFGLLLTGAAGAVISKQFSVVADDLRYEYSPPEHVTMSKVSHDFYAVHTDVLENHRKELEFDPRSVTITCDPASCDQIMAEAFTGLSRDGEFSAEVPDGASSAMKSLMGPRLSERNKERKEGAFQHFRMPDAPGHRFYGIAVERNDEHIVGLYYDNWDGFEVQYGVIQSSTDPEALNGPIFGYYTEETLKTTDPYDIERRDDAQSRWHEVYSIDGTVSAGLDDPEILEADIEFGITIKQDLPFLPFFIADIPRGNRNNAKRATLAVNSIQMDGEELTWIKTSRFGGLVVLPRTFAEGDEINLRMSFATRAIVKENPTFSQMARFGWMPFVRFGDFIDDFALTIKTSSRYKTLGVGQRMWEKTEGDVTTSHWEAEEVVFPTIIFGKYATATPRFDAKKSDGTVIPVEVHVDEVSMGQLAIEVVTGKQAQDSFEAARQGSRGIRGKQLRPIAEQAANSINLFTELSGLDYPYGELNLVNDPQGFLYGQAPSSLIYLGAFVFRGEGTVSGDTTFGSGGGTRTSKFLKSVVAHEVGHQWWGSRISNANQRNYWFVESLAEYFSALYLEAVFGKKEYEEQVDEWRGNVLNSKMKVSVQNASVLWQGEDGGRSYQSSVYSKGPYAFHILRETFGDEKFFPFLKKFSMELAAKREIVTRDIQIAAEAALGGVDENGNPYNVDLDWFFDQWIRGVGIPQYKLDYTTRQTEDGSWLVEGKITQRVVIGDSRSLRVMEGKFYRGVINVSVEAKKGETYTSRLIIEGAETPFKLKVAEKPLEVAVNKMGEMLAHDVVVNEDWN
jgi:hypothetical protein